MQAFKDGVALSKKTFKTLWKDEDNALLFRGLLLLIFFVGSMLVVSGVGLYRTLRPAKAPVAEKHEEEDSEGGHDAAPLPVVGVRAVPKAITRRQDGVPEDDKDLVEPEIQKGRGLASLGGDNTPTQPYNPFVTFLDIQGSTSEQGSQVGRLSIDISFEADSYEAMTELQAREKEVKFVIGSLIGEIPYEQMRTEAGPAKLKKRIFDEINYTLKKGKIRDVLYQNFVMR